MAFTATLSPSCTSSSSSYSTSSSALISQPLNPLSRSGAGFLRFPANGKPRRSWRHLSVSASASSAALQALIFDCDGVILESEHLHRQAYNDAFAHFNVRCSPSPQPLTWDPDFYDVLQNRVGGGKPKMRWFFFLFLNLFYVSVWFPNWNWEFMLVIG